jgi:hypothetical protein
MNFRNNCINKQLQSFLEIKSVVNYEEYASRYVREVKEIYCDFNKIVNCKSCTLHSKDPIEALIVKIKIVNL